MITFEKLSIEDNKFNLNLKFYYLLKHLIKTALTDKQANDLLLRLISHTELDKQIEVLCNYSEAIRGKVKSEQFRVLIGNIVEQIDIDIFLCSLRFYIIKDWLLEESKVKNLVDSGAMHDTDLSLKYDEKSLYRPYATRVKGA